MTIRVLDDKTIAQIAAGEVVARPASVVKELVENALDAGARQVSVEAQGGGIGLIRVMDNGAGIPAEEVATAFARHATSKIRQTDDLQSVVTLGFRGEALPSIAAVAGVEMLTCEAGSSAGTLVTLEDGNVVSRRSQARAPGTTVTVRNLFQQVPVRRKFLKSAATENSHIANVVSQYALAFPEVRFSLLLEGKPGLQTSGRGRLLEAVIEVYGLELAGQMLAVGETEAEWTDKPSDIKVVGLVSAPKVSRAGRGHQSFFVNRRWVNSRLLAWALEEAYHGLLMTGRHPAAVLNISLPPAEVDVNIHPAKSEVKFRDERAVFSAVQRAVRQALLAQSPVPQVEESTAIYAPPAGGKQALPDWWAESSTQPAAMPQARLPLTASLPVLRVLGQVMGRYLVAEGDDGLYLIDQHAAHERMRFEQLREQRAQRAVEVQGLLAPATFAVSPRQDEVLKPRYRDLAEYGFNIEPFGAREYLVRAVPQLLAGADWAAVLREVLDAFSGGGTGDWAETVLKTIACHGAVRAGQVLSDNEMRELVRQLERTANPHTCPHGRPTVIHLSRAQLEKDFGRS